jgi:hypothetical protein
VDAAPLEGGEGLPELVVAASVLVADGVDQLAQELVLLALERLSAEGGVEPGGVGEKGGVVLCVEVGREVEGSVKRQRSRSSGSHHLGSESLIISLPLPSCPSLPAIT